MVPANGKNDNSFMQNSHFVSEIYKLLPNVPAIPKRPLFKICIATLNPSPTSPMTFSTGILQSSKYTSAVFEHLIPIFFSGGPLETPPKPRSTMNAVTLSRFLPVLGSWTSVWAKTVRISAIPPLEIHIWKFRKKIVIFPYVSTILI